MAIEQQMALSEQLLECRSRVAQMAVQLKEARIEIKGLRKRLPGNNAPWTLKELDDAKARITEQDREIKRLRNSWNHWDKQNKERAYQRRHRKWALKQAIISIRFWPKLIEGPLLNFIEKRGLLLLR